MPAKKATKPVFDRDPVGMGLPGHGATIEGGYLYPGQRDPFSRPAMGRV